MSDWHEEEAKAECLDLRIKVRELEAQMAELTDYLHEIYHIDKRGTDEVYDDWQAMCDVGGVISRYMKSRSPDKGEL